MIMVREQRPQLLGHPVCLALMRYKWKSVGRPLFYFNLILYLSFLTLLTVYTVGRLNYRTFPGNSASKEDNMVGCKYLVLASVILLIGGEIGEMYRVRRRFSDQSPLFFLFFTRCTRAISSGPMLLTGLYTFLHLCSFLSLTFLNTFHLARVAMLHK